jgi:hypothetical protein
MGKKINSESEKEKKAAAKAKRMKNLKPFPKGVSGNPNGRPKGTYSIKTIIERVLNDEIDLTVLGGYENQVIEIE